jgi:hypothetical protein
VEEKAITALKAAGVPRKVREAMEFTQHAIIENWVNHTLQNSDEMPASAATSSTWKPVVLHPPAAEDKLLNQRRQTPHYDAPRLTAQFILALVDNIEPTHVYQAKQGYMGEEYVRFRCNQAVAVQQARFGSSTGECWRPATRVGR